MQGLALRGQSVQGCLWCRFFGRSAHRRQALVNNARDALASITAGLGVSELSALSKVYRHKARCLSVLGSLSRYIDSIRSEHPELAVALYHAHARVLKRLDTYTTISEQERQLRTAEDAAAYFDVPVEVFRKPSRTGLYARTFRKVARSSYRKVASSDFTFRAMVAMSSCPGWYPFFVTLTNSPAHPRVFDTGEEWSKFLERYRYALRPHGAKHACSPVDFQSFGVLERRTRNNRRPCLLYTSPSPRDRQKSRMPSSA